MALATGPIVWTLPRKYRRLAPCRSRIRLLVHRAFVGDLVRSNVNAGQAPPPTKMPVQFLLRSLSGANKPGG